MSRALGTQYENQAAELLEGLGYVVVDRNFACKGGEIDLVCLDGEVLVFVEVRGRADSRYGAPEETIAWAKRRRLLRAAWVYLLRRVTGEPVCRFDVIAIDDAGARLYRDAFRLEDLAATS
jgi:putative endonuclease